MSVSPATQAVAQGATAVIARTRKTLLLTSFQDFGLNHAIARALAEEKYLTPTPIQAQTIPTVMSGRDVIGIAQTGTGKTAAFALPILHRLAAAPQPPAKKACRVLVLSPTRELSGQILDSFRTYGRHLRITGALVIGGVPMGGQVRVPYADLGRLPVTLWEHREAMQRLRAAGRRTADEHAVFAAIAEQRHVLREAQSRSKAARRAIARLDFADRATAVPAPDGGGQGAAGILDAEARVPMPREGETSGVEFW